MKRKLCCLSRMQNDSPTFLMSQPRTSARTSSTMKGTPHSRYALLTVFVFIRCRPTRTRKAANVATESWTNSRLHGDPRKLYTIAYPGVVWGGSLDIFSTHRGTYNYFNELLREITERGNPKKFSLHRVTLEDALAQGFLYKLQQKLP